MPKRYIEKFEYSGAYLEVSANSIDEKDPPDLNVPSDLEYRLVDASGEQVWIRPFPDVIVQKGLWHGFSIVAMSHGRAFAGISSELHELDVRDGSTRWKLSTGNTQISKILACPKQDAILVLNNYYGAEGSNLSKVSLDGQLLWKAKFQGYGGDDAYVAMGLLEGRFLAWTWSCSQNDIDLETGNVLKSVFTK